MPYPRWRAAAPVALFAALAALAAQSEQSRYLAQLWPYQRAPGMREAHFDLGGGGFQTFIPTGDC
jgi:hypothetical protein